ncbi:MAG TPA: DoxX-like family protein [Acidimicrobiales bacterium]
MRRRPIYVESRIRCGMEELWASTQDPELHQRWDVRFGEITYLARGGDEPQRFRYSTAVVPGVAIAGTGESLGERNRPDGSRWSGLRFWANDRRSIIKAGAGYWRYIPTDDGIRFLTRYDYRPRWGWAGELADRWMFRPLFGWATAWSFDRLRLWLEESIAPECSRDQAIAHASAVAGLVGVWLYQGLVPKLWRADPSEVAIWRSFGLDHSLARKAVRAVGAAEVAIGLGTVVGRRRRGLFVATSAAMPLLALAATKADRIAATRAFNPVSLNWAVAALAVVAAATGDRLPSGRKPLRSAPDHQPDVDPLP